MNHLVTSEFLELFSSYPLRSQESKKDPLIVAKLFDAYGCASWYLTEFDVKDNLAFGYVSGLLGDTSGDEWGYISLQELASIKLSGLGVPRIERDLYFDQQRFSQLVQS